jgi:hypothetical protein
VGEDWETSGAMGSSTKRERLGEVEDKDVDVYHQPPAAANGENQDTPYQKTNKRKRQTLTVAEEGKTCCTGASLLSFLFSVGPRTLSPP